MVRIKSKTYMHVVIFHPIAKRFDAVLQNSNLTHPQPETESGLSLLNTVKIALLWLNFHCSGLDTKMKALVRLHLQKLHYGCSKN